jgi:hypothetical protein
MLKLLCFARTMAQQHNQFIAQLMPGYVTSATVYWFDIIASFCFAREVYMKKMRRYVRFLTSGDNNKPGAPPFSDVFYIRGNKEKNFFEKS